MNATRTDRQQIRRTFTAGAFIRGEVRSQVENYLFRNGLQYTPIREIKHLLGSEYLVEFYGSRDDARRFDLFMRQVKEQLATMTVTIPVRRYRAMRDRVDLYSQSKTMRGVFRRKAEITLNIANTRNLYFSLLRAKGQEAADLAEILRQGLIQSGWGVGRPDGCYGA